jgi:hypothetical protein
VSARTLAVTGFGLAIASVQIGACGGKVDGASSGSSGTTTAPTARPTPTGRPGRPPPAPATSASVASEIAEAYCKAFSSCCVGAGQPPIDVARCRQLVAVDIEAAFPLASTPGAEEVATCVEIIKERTTACSAVDAPWWASSTTALLAPGTVTYACAGIFALSMSPTIPCTSDASCSGLASKCAVDQCVAKSPVGSPCAETSSCLDGTVCIAGKCQPSPDVTEKGACTTSDDCRLGLVCAKGICLPSRDVPELGTRPRFSPYRVGADTCRAYTYL